MGMKPEGGYQFTTVGQKNFRYSGRVDAKVLKDVLDLLKLPDFAKQLIANDEIKTISIMAPEPGHTPSK